MAKEPHFYFYYVNISGLLGILEKKKKIVGCSEIHIYSYTCAYKLCYPIILEFQLFNQTENQPS